MKDLNRLTERLGYTFRNPKFLKQALTHRSAASSHNERLEFLGDAILNAVITTALYHRFPDENEGQLSRLRAHLVKGDMLAQIALEIQLGDFLFLGPGELKTGGFRRSSILADALEAVFAAIYLDQGFHAAEQVILALYHSRLENNLASINTKDPKTELQEYLQARKKSLPEYTLLSAIETEVETSFHVNCRIQSSAHDAKKSNRPLQKLAEASEIKHQGSIVDLQTTGVGQTRRKAEQEAALALLDLLKKMENGS